MNATGAGILKKNFQLPTSIDQSIFQGFSRFDAIESPNLQLLFRPEKRLVKKESYPNGSYEVDKWMMLAKRRWMR